MRSALFRLSAKKDHSRIELKTMNKSANESRYSSACSSEIIKEWRFKKYFLIRSLKFWLNLYCIPQKLKILGNKKTNRQIEVGLLKVSKI